jgi:HEAT repeat protein
VNQVAELVRALPLAVREEIVAAAVGALAEDASREALDALSGAVAPDTMLQALRRVAAEGPLGEHALRLMRALSAALPAAGPQSDEHPTPELLDELRRMFASDDADRFNPEDHGALLEQAQLVMPRANPGVVNDLGARAADLADDQIMARLGWACLEMLGQLGTRDGFQGTLGRLEAVFQELVASGQLEAATTLAEEMHELAVDETTAPVLRTRLEEAMARMGAPHVLAGLLEALHRRGAQASALARRLIDALGGAAGRSFLLALVEEEDKSRRRRLLELLVSIGPPIVPHVVGLLGDGRWYVVRNMVLLLHRIGDRVAVDQIRRTASHPDLRVRLEAIKCLLSFDPRLSADLLEKAIKDPDPKLAETAVALAGNYGIREAVPPMLDIVDSYDLFGARRALRLKVLKALGELGAPAALPRLERFFRNWRMPMVALEERRAAFRSLQGYDAAARADLVARGLQSNDAEIRRICAALPREQAAPAAEGNA